MNPYCIGGVDVKLHAHGIRDELNAVLGHPLYPLGEAVQRLQEERSLLMEEWNELFVLTRSIIRHRNSRSHEGEIRWLKEKAEDFREDLRCHAAWAEEQLRPLLERALDNASGRPDDLQAVIRSAEDGLEQFIAVFGAAASDPVRVREISERLPRAARAFDGLFRLEGELLDELWARTDADGAG